jgi:hypothetical protein
MRRNGTTIQFRLVLGTLNVLAMVYPIVLVRRADTVDTHLFATFVLVGMVLLLAVVDAFSILVADAIGGTKGDDKQSKTGPD